MGKSSFTLFETLISIVLLSFIVVGFSKILHYKSLDEQYQTLNSLDNSFNNNSYNSDFSKKDTTINIVINDSEVKKINVLEHIYKDENLKLVKYELK